MVQVSKENEQQTHNRLKSVIAQADFKVYEGTYIFEEFPLAELTQKINTDALALVRDQHVWSQLVRSTDQSKELFTLFSFHFDNAADNSGFVGWLATYLKRELGTGVFVTCGQNSSRGGIFDYWGCPSHLGEEAIRVVQDLMGKNI